MVAGLAAVGATVGVGISAGADTQRTMIAHDAMQRTVARGWGSADLGGAYGVSSLMQSSVSPGSAKMAAILPGRSILATLSAVSIRDVGVELSVRPSLTGALGGGLYTYVLLRRQANGDTYLAKFRLLSGGKATIALARDHAGRETALGGQVVVPGLSATNPAVTIDAQALGTTSVHLYVQAWATGRSKAQGASDSYTDRSASRVSNPGAIGFMSYLSQSAVAPATTSMAGFTAWAGGIGTPPTPIVAPPSVVPSVVPSSSAAPSSSAVASATAPAPTTSASDTSGPPAPPSPTPTPGSSGTAGAAPLGSTRYPIPNGAIFVSPSGNDGNSGTIDSPVRSLVQAIKVAAAGATIVLRAGDYNESVEIPATKPLTVQNYPGEVVWLDGSTPLDAWTQNGNTWVHSGWTEQFDSTPSFTPGSVPSGANWTFVNPSYPMAAHPDQLFVDGVSLQQVSSAAAVTAGTFYADYAGQKLVMGTNPNGHAVQASDLSLAITVYSAGSVLRGFGVHRYATSIDQIGTVRLQGSSDSISNVVSDDNATIGLTVGASNVHVTNVTLERNGLLGMHADFSDGLVVDSMLAQDNNSEHFNYAPVSGGIKVTRARVVTIRNSVIQNNLGVGIWFDQAVYGVTVTGNQLLGNAGHGLSFEISSTGIFADNVVERNGGDGFKINDSDHVEIWNNTFAANQTDVQLVQDTRRGSDLSVPGHDPRRSQPDPTEPWINSDIQFMNNVLSPAAAGSYELYVNDYSGQYSAAQLNITMNGDQFTRPTSGIEIGWGIGGNHVQNYSTTASFAAGTGQGAQDSELVAGVTATGTVSTMPLPADIAAAIGQSVGVIHVGVF